jgi:hypothetical protein
MLTILGFFTILLRTNWFSDFAAMEKSVQNRVCPKNCQRLRTYSAALGRTVQDIIHRAVPEEHDLEYHEASL